MQARRAGYLCFECSDKLGGSWPKGHVATSHSATCPICNKTKTLVAWDDFDWPGPLGREAKVIREF